MFHRISGKLIANTDAKRQNVPFQTLQAAHVISHIILMTVWHHSDKI